MQELLWNVRSHAAYFQAYIIHYHEPTCIAEGEAKHALLLQMSGDHGKEMPFYLFLIIFFLPNIFLSYEERKGEEGEKVKHKEISQI